MNFKRNDNQTGCLQGYIEVAYSRLVQVFGLPHGKGNKSTAVWNLEFEDGTTASIYDIHQHANRFKKEVVTSWHIGGRNSTAVDLVKSALGLTR